MPVIEGKAYKDYVKSSMSASFEDGRGDASTPESKVGTRYIYYRLYTKDGPLESNNPIYSNDRFVSRVCSTFVRPPHTAASLKRYLCKIEGLGAFKNCTLYQSLSDKTALDDSTRLSFRGTPGPGSSDLDPIALVADTHSSEMRSQATSTGDAQELLERDYEERYLYYRLYDEDGLTKSKTSFGRNNPFLGRASTLSIPPPHTPAFLKYHLIKSEEINGHNIQLFEDEDNELSMDDSHAIALLADSFPGSIDDRPIAIAYESQENIGSVDNEDPNEILARDPYKARSALEELQRSNETHACEVVHLKGDLETTKETHTRELREARSRVDQLQEELKMSNEAHARELRLGQQSPVIIKILSERLSFTKQLKATKDDISGSKDSAWHSMKVGEILYTDGVWRQEEYWNGNTYSCLLAINSSGKIAFADTDNCTLCYVEMTP